ncbi:MAG: ATP-dependent DNA helicase [Actinomycetota bacterium]
MSTVSEQIQNADEAICKTIASLVDQRGLLSQNLLAQLRNLVEGVAVYLHTKQPDAEFKQSALKPGLAFIKADGKLNFLSKFHKLIQASASHYTMGEDASERLMLKYYEHLLRVRTLLQDNYGISVLANLESFPIDLDPSLQEYHERIAARIESVRSSPPANGKQNRYYIHKTRPFFVGGRIYYEVTFGRAENNVSKFDRIIAFTDIDMTDKYSATLTLLTDSIDVLGQSMPVTIIREWEVSIRPCEFDNFARLFGIVTKVKTGTPEYRYLMQRLTDSSGSLLDFIEMADDKYAAVRAEGTVKVGEPQIFPALDKARRIVRNNEPGHNVIRYLMLRMHNQILKKQYKPESCNILSGLNLQWGCIPFDTMPFCTSLWGHNPRYWDLVESLDVAERKHELLARRIQNNVENNGILYTPVVDVEEFGDLNELIARHHRALYRKHQAKRSLGLDKEHVFICEYEKDTAAIIEKLQKFASSGVDDHTDAVERWLEEIPRGIDDEAKKNALKRLFSQSRVAFIYGAAGTGKSTMVHHIADYFDDKQKLFLAHTNPAVDNLKRKVTAQNSTFRTISSQVHGNASGSEYDLLVIDECSTVSNTDLIKLLEKTSFKLLVLVGDVYQIESIKFGNWFDIARSFIPSTSVFELTTPFRAKDKSLPGFWKKVRDIDEDITEVMAHNGYSTVLDKSLFEDRHGDEIVLCLNYDGLYGINNINRFLQSSNLGAATNWRDSTYKVGDPVLFNESERFRPVIYNNMKGQIVGIEHSPGRIQFDVKLDRAVTEADVRDLDLTLVGDSTVRFAVSDLGNSDEDEDTPLTTMPFQVAYAVSIHKAQGLEYDSVKIVITNANEDNITHNIFYTAVTRSRDRLRIFWTPEAQQTILKSLRRNINPKDVDLLIARQKVAKPGG